LPKQNISGVLLLDKPYGLSSNAALQKAKLIFNAAKAGHTGTLDPLATGLLPICFGEATKFSSFLLDANKEYIATIKLGISTTTYDAEGVITATNQVMNSPAEVLKCINTFLGTITQYPPIYSALKVNGRALYDYARNGEEVTIKSREITIHELELLEFISSDEFTLRILSSKGTYIRSLAHDIGQKLGCGAHLSGLVRTKTNNFTLQQAKTLNELANSDPEDIVNLLLPVDILVGHLSKIALSETQYARIRNGHPCESAIASEISSLVRLYYTNRFLGIATYEDRYLVKPIRLLNSVNLMAML
jgi:tRNA pseudouridine55 synthase